MSATAIRFAPRTRAQRGIRTGMLAYMGLAEKAARAREERYEAALTAAEEAWCWAQVEKPVAATRIGGAGVTVYQTHYAAGVKVTYRHRKHTILTASY